MVWLSSVPVLLTSLGLFIVPGILLAFALGVRGFNALAISPLLSTALVGSLGILGGWTGIRWSLWFYLSGSIALAALVFIVSLSWKKNRTQQPSTDVAPKNLWIWTSLGLAIPAILITRRLAQVFQSPENIGQMFDNVFHLNAVRYIVDSGNASTLELGSLNGSSGFAAIYPSAWHSFVALVAQATGSSIPMAVNSTNIVMSAVVWPLSVMFLTRLIVGRTATAVLVSGILSAAQLAFPYMLMLWGPLYPNALSISLLPVALGIIVILSKRSREKSKSNFSWWLILLTAIAALATSHTSAINTLLALSLPLFIVIFVSKATALYKSRVGVGPWIFWGISVFASAFGFLAVWNNLRPSYYNDWAPSRSFSAAVGEGLLNSPMWGKAVIAVSVLSLIGAIYALTNKKYRWSGFSYLIMIFLFVVGASFDKGSARWFFIGGWYQDTFRLAAFIPIMATVMGAIGAQLISVWLIRNFSVLKGQIFERYRIISAMIVALVIAGLILATQLGGIQSYLRENKQLYTIDEKSTIINSDEAILLGRLDEKVPRDAIIADNPWNGSSLAYALANRKVMTYHMFSIISDDQKKIFKNLGMATPGSRTCDIAQKMNVRYILDFGNQFLVKDSAARDYPGVTGLDPSPGLQLVDSQGEAKLYKVIACD